MYAFGKIADPSLWQQFTWRIFKSAAQWQAELFEIMPVTRRFKSDRRIGAIDRMKQTKIVETAFTTFEEDFKAGDIRGPNIPRRVKLGRIDVSNLHGEFAD